MVSVIQFIAQNEGIRLTAYDDSLGVKTIGVGFNLEKAGAKDRIETLGYDYDSVFAGISSLTLDDVMTLLSEDVDIAIDEVRRVIPGFDTMSPTRRMAFIDMTFNMGATRLAGFKRMIAALKRKDFNTAADEAQDSKWFRTVRRRGPIIVEMIRNGG